MAKIINSKLANDKNKNSRFWLDSKMFSPEGGSSSISRKLKLLAYKRSISNFVKILTQKDGYVIKFSTGDDSYTDGKTVVISSKLDENNFDVTVGLALHEASHLLLSDFKLIRQEALNEAALKHGALGLQMVNSKLKIIFNIVEDRYVDNYVYTMAPGYRGYYQAFYDYYFRSEKIAKLLKSKNKCTETVDNYISQLLNIIGLEFDVNRMPGLAEIVKELDLSNIKRCVTSADRLSVAANIYAIILKYVNNSQVITNNTSNAQPKPPKKQSIPKNNETEDSDLDTSATSASSNEPDEESLNDESDDNFSNDADADENEDYIDSDDNFSNDADADENEDYIDSEAEDLLDTAMNVANGKVNKDGSVVNNNLNSTLEALDISGAELIKSEVDLYNNDRVKYSTMSVNCILVKNLTKKIAMDRIFDCLLQSYEDDNIKTSIQRGILLGTSLAKRMEVRNEERNTISNRLKAGKIFNRHIALLGADVDNIFYKIKTDKFKNSTIHISIDASGSMGGINFNNSIMMSVAIAKACTFLRGVNCIISFRSMHDKLPLMAIAYNSKKDHISKISELFPYLSPNSTTPEGLCYDVYKNFIATEDGKDVDKYIINLSDGEPEFSIHGSRESYTGYTALEHSRKAWNNILKLGVTGLSYYIKSNSPASSKFLHMYGKDAKTIEPSNLIQLTSTINEMLMSRSAISRVVCE